MAELPERNCYNCKNFNLCYLRRHLWDMVITLGGNMLNIDGTAAPGNFQDLFVALAGACTEFKLAPKGDR